MERGSKLSILNDFAILECADVFVDIEKEISECEKKGINRQNIRVVLSDYPQTTYIDVDTLKKVRKQLEILTSDVEPSDDEIEKFAKITASIRKNLSYAHGKTKSRNIGATANFVDGLVKGKCVCIGYSIITKMALNMHGIDAEMVESNVKSTENMISGHAWNKVKLRDTWYNWDMTNVASDSLTADTMGKCLKTDEDIEKKEMYRNNNSTIVCNKNPEKSLVDEINRNIKDNKRNIPKLPKESIFSKIRQQIASRIQNIKSKLFKQETKLLPEGSNTHREENKTEIEFFSCEKVMELEDRQSTILRLQSWDKGDVRNKFTTAYLELAGLEDGQRIEDILSDEKFQVFYKILLDLKDKNEPYIGKIHVIKTEKGETSFCAAPIETDECKVMVEGVRKVAQNFEKTKLEYNRNGFENQQRDENTGR